MGWWLGLWGTQQPVCYYQPLILGESQHPDHHSSEISCTRDTWVGEEQLTLPSSHQPAKLSYMHTFFSPKLHVTPITIKEMNLDVVAQSLEAQRLWWTRASQGVIQSTLCSEALSPKPSSEHPCSTRSTLCLTSMDLPSRSQAQTCFLHLPGEALRLKRCYLQLQHSLVSQPRGIVFFWVASRYLEDVAPAKLTHCTTLCNRSGIALWNWKAAFENEDT